MSALLRQRSADTPDAPPVDPPSDAPAETGLAHVWDPALHEMRDIIMAMPNVDEDPTPRMMAAILAAPDAASWEELFSTESFKDSVGKRIRITAVRWSESNFKSRVPIFLILDYTDLQSGETGVMTCGSEMAMAQILWCVKRGEIPHDFEVVVKDTPTKRGFRPMRLRSLGSKVMGDPADVIDSTAEAV